MYATAHGQATANAHALCGTVDWLTNLQRRAMSAFFGRWASDSPEMKRHNSIVSIFNDFGPSCDEQAASECTYTRLRQWDWVEWRVDLGDGGDAGIPCCKSVQICPATKQQTTACNVLYVCIRQAHNRWCEKHVPLQEK